MEIRSTAKSKSNMSNSNKRLLFDRRYGWVIDEWKTPSQEALAGGRGMFCVVPLAKGLLHMASHSINIATNSAIEVIDRRDRFNPLQFHNTVGNQLQKLADSVQKPGLNFLSKGETV